MSRLKKIDLLLVFLTLSVFTLYAFVGDIHYFFRFNKANTYKTFVQAKTVLEIPEQGQQNSVELSVYNAQYKVEYSLDGGKSFQVYNQSDLMKINTPDLSIYPTSIRYKHPYGYFPELKTFLIRAKHKSKDVYLKPVPLTYFQKYNSNLPVVSLIINTDDLFSLEQGMMVLGQASWQDDGFNKRFWDRNANYKQRKGKWKKQAYFQYFEDGNLKSEVLCDAAISGNATRAFVQKSLKLKSNKVYGEQKFAFPFFGKNGEKKYASLVLRNSGNDNKKTLFADRLMQKLAISDHLLIQEGRAVNVFINGYYWGIYNLRERYDKYLIAKKENVKKRDITILEGAYAELKSGDEKVQEDFIQFIDSLSTLNIINEEVIKNVEAEINLLSFMDYIFNETFFGNGDWLNNNAMWFKADQNKWKWVLNDLDYGLAYTGAENVNKNYFTVIQQSNTYTAKLYKILMKNERFKRDFKDRARTNLGLMYEDDRVPLIFNEIKTEVEQNIDWQVNRWRGNFSKKQWEENCQANYNFLMARQSKYLKQIEAL